MSKDIIYEECIECKTRNALLNIEKNEYYCRNCEFKLLLNKIIIKSEIEKFKNMPIKQMHLLIKACNVLNKQLSQVNDDEEWIDKAIIAFLKGKFKTDYVINLDKKNKYRLSGIDYELFHENKKLYFELTRLRNKDMKNDNTLAQLKKRIENKANKYLKMYKKFNNDINISKNYTQNNIDRKLFKNINLLIFECRTIYEIQYENCNNPAFELMDFRHNKFSEIKSKIHNFIIKNEYDKIFNLIILITNRNMDLKNLISSENSKMKIGLTFSGETLFFRK